LSDEVSHFRDPGSDVVVTADEVQGIVLFRLRGEIDSSNASDVLTQLEGAPQGRNVILDLGELSFIDSSGVRMLLMLLAHVTQHGGKLRLAVPPESRLRHVFSVLELEAAIPIDAAVSEGVGALKG
jgi:anti-anti-sigma factor